MRFYIKDKNVIRYNLRIFTIIFSAYIQPKNKNILFKKLNGHYIFLAFDILI